MGLDFSHGTASWSYSAFHRFRAALAAHEGIDLDCMEGFKPLGAGPDWVGRSWDTVTSPLKPFLDHWDCDGDLSAAECAQIAPRLREVINAVWPEATAGSDREAAYQRERGLLLVDGLEDAAACGEAFLFL